MNFKKHSNKNEKDLKNSSDSQALDDNDLDSVAGGFVDPFPDPLLLESLRIAASKKAKTQTDSSLG